MKNPIKIKATFEEKGFALIASLSIMALLVMLVVGMLTLATTETRSANQDKFVMEARANARMALMIALGELQETVGPDQRITAASSILGDEIGQKHILGVWNSWGAGIEEATHVTKDNVSDTYTKGRESRFVKWLIPGDHFKDFSYPSTNADSDSVVMVGIGSLGETMEKNMQVYMPRIPVLNDSVQTGSYSWWVSGENSKARVNLYASEATSVGEMANNSVAAPTSETSVITSLETVVDDESLKAVQTRGTLDFMGGGVKLPEAAKARFHDITVDSLGLLTNTKSGGVSKDLNLLLEQASLPTDLEKTEIYSGGPVWNDLHAHYRTYKPTSEGGKVKWVNGVPHFSAGETWSELVSNNNWRRYLPIPTKWQWLISHYSVPADPATHGPDKHEVRMVFDNIMEMWNPYTIPMNIPSDSSFDFKLWNIPYGVSYYIGGTRWNRTQSKKALSWVIKDMPESTSWQLHNAKMKIDEPLLPGEVRVFSDNSTSPQTPNVGIELKPGWEIAGGLYSYKLGHGGHSLIVDAGTEIEAHLEKDGSAPVWAGFDHFTDIYLVGPAGYPSEYGYSKGVVTNGSLETVANDLERDNEASFTAGSVSGVGNKKPLAVMGMRMRTERRIEPSSESPISKSEKALVKASIYNDPWQVDSNVFNDNQTALHHGNYEFFIQKVNSLSDYPFVEISADDKGYMGTSRGAQSPNSGQNHLPVQEIPYLPMISLGQLQHAGLGHIQPDPNHAQNPGDPDGSVPYVSYPHVANAFGNAWPLPYIDADKIEQTSIAPSDGSQKLLHDKCWKANDALWDAWCFSSISPQDQPLLASAQKRSMEQVLDDALSGQKDLPNSRYRFIDASAKQQQLASELLASEGYKEVAALLACDGAFNVNSTSVEAWKAFLASLNGRAVAWLAAETGEFDQKSDESFPVSRFTIPNGAGAESADSTSSQQDFLRKRWEGARSLTAVEVAELATEMVKQVQERGPFLSLGEFVNRRLTKDPAGLKGALQTAIDLTTINDSFKSTSVEVTLADVSAAGYKNPKAATGLSGEGAPGYVTQADILMPLAPLVRVRSDTFKIRAYGEAHNSRGKVEARAYCESIVQRYPDFVDPTDEASKEVLDSAGNNQLSEMNQKYGRKIRIKSFRWLSNSEV